MERLKLYHGSNAIFEQFDQKKARIQNDFYGGGVAYFTDDLTVAKSYAKGMSKKQGLPIVYSAEVSFRNLFDIDEEYKGKPLLKLLKMLALETFARGAKLLGLGVDKFKLFTQ